MPLNLKPLSTLLLGLSLLTSNTFNPDHEDTHVYTKADSSQVKVQAGIGSQNVSFGVSTISGHSVTQPTSLQFGPDGKLYVVRKKGNLNILTIERIGANDYQVVDEETLGAARSVLNHNDDGELNTDEKTRQATGLVVGGTPANPIVYISSSDPRVGGHEGNPDTGLDTNSGVISRLSWIGADRDDVDGYWEQVDIVRGLPRSEENHANNGMQLSLDEKTLYVAVGGMTNAGAPSNNFAHINEYALAAAILSIDLEAVEAMPVQIDAEGKTYIYNLPTLDDPERANANSIEDPLDPAYDGIDVNDPWGGNDGLNQAKIVRDGPVQIHSPGYRNAYDLVVTRTEGREGRMYTIDNGPNKGWGGHPLGEGSYGGASAGQSAGQCTNDYDPAEPGSSVPGPNDDTVLNMNGLHFVRELVEGDQNFVSAGEKYYGGHPTPIRGNPAGAGLFTGAYHADPISNTSIWRDGSNPAYPLPVDWPPVPVEQANPAECDFRNATINDGALIGYNISTNGLAEYTASNFDNALKGNLFGVGYNESRVYRIVLNDAGDQVVNGEEIFAENFSTVSLDITTLGDEGLFPGTMWVTGFNEHELYVFEPADYDDGVVPECTASVDATLDEDQDGYNNEDETQNEADPCSAASTPSDNDKDYISDLNDPDDDNDTIPDVLDAFAIDAANGLNTTLPVHYPLLNENPATGFFGLGFTGLMANGSVDYRDQYVVETLIPGGTAGLFTVTDVGAGDATGDVNTQENAFQFGVNVGVETGPFSIKVRMAGPFFNGITPSEGQSQGIYIGTGDMDNYLKLVLDAADGEGGMLLLHEEDGIVQSVSSIEIAGVLEATHIDLYLDVDPVAGSIQPSVGVGNGLKELLGEPINVSGDLLQAIQGGHQTSDGMQSGLAVGLIASAGSSGVPFDATWDSIDLTSSVEQETFLTSIQQGWNMVGLPVSMENYHFEAVFDEQLDPRKPFKWNGQTYEEVDFVGIEEGYWLDAKLAGDQAYTGTPLNQVTLAMIEGWNMITGPGCEMNVSQVSDPDGLIVPNTLYGYAQEYFSTSTLRPGASYWIMSHGAGQISLSCGNAGKANKTAQRKVLHEEFGRMQVQDASGKKRTLLFGGSLREKSLLLEYTLPPLAPGNQFDVRFTNGSWLAEGNEAFLKLQGLDYPAELYLTEVPSGYKDVVGLEIFGRNRLIEKRTLRIGDKTVLSSAQIDGLRLFNESEGDLELPEAFMVHGNYPNPFNPTTTLMFDLPEPANIRVAIYDLLGRLVLKMPEVSMAAGSRQQIVIDGSSLASGSYLYQISADTGSGAKTSFGRMVLLK